MQIVPMRRFENTVEIEKNVRKVLYLLPRTVMADWLSWIWIILRSAFHRRRKLNFFNRGIREYQEGKTVDGKSAMKAIREKYGI